MVDCARCGTWPSLLAFGNLETDMTPEQIEEMEAALAGAMAGPWTAALERGCHGIIAQSLPEGGANFVALVGNDYDTPEREPARFSNARLIAFAPEMAAHIIAQREQIAALEARVKAADRLQLDAQMMAQMIADSLKPTGPQNVAICPDESRTLNDAFKTIAAYQATGGQENKLRGLIQPTTDRPDAAKEE